MLLTVVVTLVGTGVSRWTYAGVANHGSRPIDDEGCPSESTVPFQVILCIDRCRAARTGGHIRSRFVHLSRHSVLKTRFWVPDEDVRDFGREFLGFARHVTPKEALDAVPSDKTDNRILT
jgi:hypothetical protein